MTPLRAVLFDAYGTLFDVHSVASVAEQSFPGRGEALSQLWRQKQIEYTRLVSMSANERGDAAGHYQPFWALTRSSLRFAAQSLDLALSPALEERLLNAYRALPTFPDVLPVLQTLKMRGIPCGILSNGDPSMLDVAVRSASLGPWLSTVLSADSVKRYKTDPAVYALGPAALSMPAKHILFVSSNGWDALGAHWYGYTTLWVNRSGQAAETLGPPARHTGTRLDQVLDILELR